MKFTMFVTSDAMQVNLAPENPHEVAFVAMLREAKGAVTLHHGADVTACRAGYIRDFGDKPGAVAIHVANEAPPPPIDQAAVDAHAALDEIGAPRADDMGGIYSIAGRIRAAANRTICRPIA